MRLMLGRLDFGLIWFRLGGGGGEVLVADVIWVLW